MFGQYWWDIAGILSDSVNESIVNELNDDRPRQLGLWWKGRDCGRWGWCARHGWGQIGTQRYYGAGGRGRNWSYARKTEPGAAACRGPEATAVCAVGGGLEQEELCARH